MKSIIDLSLVTPSPHIEEEEDGDEICAVFNTSCQRRATASSSPPTSPMTSTDRVFGTFVGPSPAPAVTSSSSGTCLDMAYVTSLAPPPLESSSEDQTLKLSPRKRTYDHMTARDKTSPRAAVATSMLAMRAELPHSMDVVSPTRARNGFGAEPIVSTAAAAAGKQTAQEKQKEGAETQGTASAGTKKTKVSRERQLKINAASRRCRKKQKLELQFLRTHVQELHAVLMDQVDCLQRQGSQQQRATRLARLVQDSVAKVEEMSSGMRMSPAATLSAPPAAFRAEVLPSRMDDHSGEDTDGTHSNDPLNYIETDDARRVHTIDPSTRYSLSDERKKELLHISSFVLVNISSESHSFAPEVISCLPIEMDDWQLRLAITEKSYTIHNQKFFPCKVNDMFDFCWETNVAQKISIKHAKKHYVVVTPLEKDVAHVYSKITGKWSLNVHGVPNVSYNSIVCRRFIPSERRAIICQQSVLEERDFQDENTLPWLFKRWVVFRPKVQDGVAGTFVEAYRTASYATGRLIYKDNKKYDSFCEHLIRRYAESNLLLEGMMARDKRFAHAFDDSVRSGTRAGTATVSDRIIKDLLLF
uniref:BZIP domain-containing protein n=1 Tax=Peronospora matthiolae TaxID=2874970 RepID=A0AAV1UHJ0_9STRA